MRSKSILSKPGKFATKLKEQERKKAHDALKGAESFLLITRSDKGNSCISAMEGDLEDMTYMAFNLHLAEEKIMNVIKKNCKEIDETNRPK
jgi:hypothetical protein